MKNAELPYYPHGKIIIIMRNLKPNEVTLEREGEAFPLATDPLYSILEQFES